MSNEKGRFISLEGSEGVGKSTSLKFIQSYIESLGHQVIMTREPGGTPLAEEVRNLLLHEREENVDPNSELLLMFAARCQLVNQVIKPALEKGIWVISDRFVDASYAYQGGGRELGFDRIEVIEQWSLQGFKPEFTLLLDMSVEEGLARTKIRGKADRFEIEQMAFFERIRAAYLKRAKQEPNRIFVVDAAPKVERVQQSIRQLLDQHFSTQSSTANQPIKKQPAEKG